MYIDTGSRLPICSDVKTRKRRNVVGIDMIRNNRIKRLSESVNIASQVSIVEVGNKHGNGDEFSDFADLLFFLA